MDNYGLEQELRKLFVMYGPIQVTSSWQKVISDFRQALAQCDVKPPTVVLKDVTEPVTKNPIVNPPVEQKPKSTSVPAPDKDAQKEKLKAHKDAITKRRQELAAQGVIPETQLTEQNLRKWIETEKKNYWQIAELTGCNDNDISSKAKALDILSDVARYIRHKRRTQI